MIQIIQLKGKDKRLYRLLAPLVMDPDVIRANNNYPFKTSEDYVWYIAVDGKEVDVYKRQLRGCTAEEKMYATKFMETLKPKKPVTPLVEKHKKNLILILVESLQSWPINLLVDGKEITPYLNSLTKEDDVLYFSKVLPQVKGRCV